MKLLLNYQPVLAIKTLYEVCFAFITYVTKQHSESHWAGEEDKNEPLKHDFKCNKRIWSDIINSE